jgi:ketosteroid isomerase-like protein
MPDITAANSDIATPELMKEISAAFNSRDVDRIASWFTEDATFWLARGPEPVGRTLKGRETIRKTLADRFKVIPDMRWDHKEYIYAGNRAISVWTVRGKGADGEDLNYQGSEAERSRPRTPTGRSSRPRTGFRRQKASIFRQYTHRGPLARPRLAR